MNAQLEPQPGIESDPLLGCLLIVARWHNLAASVNAVAAGLPLLDNRLTPTMFERAAQRVGLSARIAAQPLSKLDALHTPAVLMLDGGSACVLLAAISDDKARVISPDNPEAEVALPAAELAERYSGYAILAGPKHRYDARTAALSAAPTGHWFWGTIAKSWRIYRDVIFASLAVNLFAVASPLFIMNVYDRVVPNQAFETLWVLAAGVGIVYVFDFVLRSLRGYFVDLAGRKADLQLSAQLFERVLGMRLEARPASTGAFANSLKEFDGIRDFFTSLTLTTLVDLPFSLLFLLVVWLIAGPLVLVPIAVLPLLLLYGLFLKPRLRRAAENGFRASAQKNSTLVEGLTEAETVKALGIEGRLQQQLEAAVAEGARWSAAARQWGLSATNLASFAQQLVSVGVVIVGVYLISDGLLSMGGLIAAVILSGRAVTPLAQLAALLTRLSQASTALTALNDIMQLPVDRPPGKVFVSRPTFSGAVEFDAVSFHYPGQQFAALAEASLRIEPGERVGLIGRVASGKTTINRLVAGLYHATGGAVRIDGVDVRQLDPGDLRRNLGYVGQDPQLMFGTVRENLTLGVPEANDEQLIRAAELAGVGDFVNRHPLGFDMPVGEHGAMLSGGQKQALALARAIVLDPPILLLDEPTGSMDNSTEDKVKQGLAEATQGKTLILVTHRASLLELVNRVIVVDGGRIVADGPKVEVLAALRAGRIKQAG
jgi:ATP-binding cassette subfamily C protein LapB